MKKRTRLAIVFLAAALLLGTTAFAAEAPTAAGIYELTTASGFTGTVKFTPLTAAGEDAIAKTTVAIGGSDVTDFYANAERVKVTYTGATSGSYYLGLALSENATPTTANIVYINQDTASGTSVSFTFYPSSLTAGKTYYMYLASNSDTKITSLTQIGSFKYYAPYTLGDVDADGKFTATDALWALYMSVGKTAAGITAWTDNQKLAANVDFDKTAEGNPKITATDALYILQRSVGKRTSFGA